MTYSVHFFSLHSIILSIVLWFWPGLRILLIAPRSIQRISHIFHSLLCDLYLNIDLRCVKAVLTIIHLLTGSKLKQSRIYIHFKGVGISIISAHTLTVVSVSSSASLYPICVIYRVLSRTLAWGSSYWHCIISSSFISPRWRYMSSCLVLDTALSCVISILNVTIIISLISYLSAVAHKSDFWVTLNTRGTRNSS